MEELLMCSLCIERYHEKSRNPVLLPRCGHSFCRPCVSMLITGGCIVCPTCRTDQRIENVERLPTEYTLLAIIHAQENNKIETCERHSVKLSFWCRTCETATCGECLFEDHPTHSHDVIRAAKYIEDMKKNAQEVAVKFIEVLDDREQSYYRCIFSSLQKISYAIRNIGVLRKDMDEARELMKGIKEEDSINAATSLSEAAKFLGLKWNIQDANFKCNVKEESEKDEITIEKEKIKEALKKEQEAKKLKETETNKSSKRTLRKSKTLSSVTQKEAGKTIETDTAKEHVETPSEKVQTENTSLKAEEKELTNSVTLENNEKNEIPPPETQQQKEISSEENPSSDAIKMEPKSKEITKLEDSKTKEIKLEEITIQDIIKMKGLLKKTDDPQPHNDDVKEINNKISKPSDLPPLKPRPKFPKVVKPVVSKTPPAVATPTFVEASTQTDPLPILQAKEPEVIESPKPDQEPKDEKTTDKEKELSDEEEETHSTQDPEEAEAAIPPADISSDEDPKISKSKDPFGDLFEIEGKLMDYIQVKGFMLCVEAEDGRLAFMEWGPQGLHVHCLQFTHVNYDVVIRDSVLNTLIPSKSPTVFLELTADQTILGRVYIKLWGYLKRAYNFLSLCLGDRGNSFMNTKFLQVYNVNSPGERILGGDYETNNGRGGRGLIDDLEWNGDYAMPMKAGMITAAGSGQQATNSLFLLCTQSDPERNFSCPFGLICEGLNVVREAVQQTATKQVWITDCGVLVVPPKFEPLFSS